MLTFDTLVATHARDFSRSLSQQSGTVTVYLRIIFIHSNGGYVPSRLRYLVWNRKESCKEN